MSLSISTPKSFSSEYWEKTWRERISKDKVTMNGEKLNFITTMLWQRTQYIESVKLDIGCGSGIHALRMKNLNPLWVKSWTGIDESKFAVDWGKSKGLNMIHGDVITTEFDRKFDLFLLLDVLEHITSHELLAIKMKGIAKDKFSVFGNIPLYRSQHSEEFERYMDINVLMKFLKDLGCNNFWHDIYGIKGYPYMVFEACV
ncbi:MAG: methyltransferase domain-containing protein [Candidatus Scalindua sp.]